MKHLLVLLLCAALTTTHAQIVLSLEEVASGFTKPLEIVHAGDERLFVVEQPGRIRILWPDGTVAPQPFLDITDRVLDNANERGLLGLAFHPQYATNGWFFVNYTGSGGKTVVSRFSVSADPDLADPDSELVLLEITQPFANHNGGCIRFGPDGYLYIGTGDGGAGGDPLDSGQDPLSLLGKMLRIDVDGPGPYAIPPDNPFFGNDFTLDEIWALGLRNPWRFSFDRLTGDLWIGDVGQNEWEEIDFQPATSSGGENYGWRCYEGYAPYNTSGCGTQELYTFPVHVYENSNAVGRSVTGGYVYRGSAHPALYGAYIFGDYVSGRIWALWRDSTGTVSVEELLDFNNNELSSFGEDLDGELYACGHGSGRIFRLVDQCAAFGLSANVTPPCPGAADGQIELVAVGAHGAVSWLWHTGDTASVLHDLPQGTWSVTATDALGCQAELQIALEPVWSLPVVAVDGATLSVADTFPAYQWLLDGQPIAGAIGPVWQAQSSGVYVLQVITPEGCVLLSEPVEVTVSALGLLPKGIEAVELVPNPFSETAFLKGHASRPLAVQLSLVQADGREVWRMQARLEGDFSFALPVERLPKGIWWVRLETDEGQWTGRAVKR